MGAILGLDGQPLTPEREPTSDEMRRGRMEQVLADPTARGTVNMQLSFKMLALASYPIEHFIKLLEAEEAFEGEWQKTLDETPTSAVSEETKTDFRQKRDRAMKCLRAFIEVKPAINAALRAHGLADELIKE